MFFLRGSLIVSNYAYTKTFGYALLTNPPRHNLMKKAKFFSHITLDGTQSAQEKKIDLKNKISHLLRLCKIFKNLRYYQSIAPHFPCSSTCSLGQVEQPVGHSLKVLIIFKDLIVKHFFIITHHDIFFISNIFFF